jgi:hypothetical protein
VITDPHLRLLSIGNCLYEGAALAPSLDRVGRRILLPAIQAAARKGVSTLTSAGTHGRQWDVIAMPVRGTTAQVHAVLACYTDRAERSSWPPLVGAWEWDTSDLDALRTFWTPELFTLYGIDPPSGSRGWDAADWFRLLEGCGYAQMRAVLARFLSAPSGQLITHVFRIARADTGRLQTMRLAGTVERDSRGVPTRLRGITTCVDGCCYELHDCEMQQQLIDATTALSGVPVVVVDLDSKLMRSIGSPWEIIGLHSPHTAALAAVVHPDDLTPLLAFLASAPLSPTQAPALTRVRFSAAPGWHPVSVAAVRIRIVGTKSSTYHAVIRLGPVDDRSPFVAAAQADRHEQRPEQQ